MADGRIEGSTASEHLREIAGRLERLASDARAAAGEALDEEPVAEGVRRLHDEADRAVAEAVRVLDRSVDAARVRILDAEREARERILAATEAACERIEAVDHAQERVAEALSRLGRRPG